MIENFSFFAENRKSVERNGLCFVQVYDEIGQRLNNLANAIFAESPEQDSPESDLEKWTRWLRWQWAHSLVDNKMNLPNPEFWRDFQRFCTRSKYMLEDESRLFELMEIVEEAEQKRRSSMFEICTESLTDFRPGKASILVANKYVKSALTNYVPGNGTQVLTAKDLWQRKPNLDAIFVYGFPRSFPSAIWSAPSAPEITYVYPHWLRNPRLPTSQFQQMMFDFELPKPRIIKEGFPSKILEGTLEGGDFKSAVEEKDIDTSVILEPGPISLSRLNTPFYEIDLEGGWKFFAEQKNKIKCLVPSLNGDLTIEMKGPLEIEKEDIVLIRTGSSERTAMDKAIRKALGKSYGEVEKTQIEWKKRLSDQLRIKGAHQLKSELYAAGVGNAHRLEAWIEPDFIRPHSDLFFAKLLLWLGLDPERFIANADSKRSAVHQAAWQMKCFYESQVVSLDVPELESKGFVDLRTDSTEEFPYLIALVRHVQPVNSKASVEIGTPIRYGNNQGRRVPYYL